jgi:hypothetical protein
MTRATQKVQETESTWSKSKGKGKVEVDDKAREEAWLERLKKVKAILQDIVDQLEL